MAAGLGALIAAHASWAEALARHLSGGLISGGLSLAESTPGRGHAPLPVVPTVPAPTSSSSGGLGAGAWVGLGLGALLLLFALSPPGGSNLSRSRDFLRPNSALVLAIERPG